MPSDYQAELLDILVEECAEVQQRVIKAKRFGLDEVQPEQPYDNTERTSQEVGDLLAVIELCVNAGLIKLDIVEAQHPIKMAKLDKFMQYKYTE